MDTVHVRSRKLIKPSFQLRLTAKFAGLTAAALVLQFLLLDGLLSGALRGSEHAAVLELIPGIALRALVLALAVLLPALFVLGALLTHRVAGPIYRFETYLRALARGEQTGPCTLRPGDELDGLCDAVNAVAERIKALEARAAERKVA
jgi:hypothetical protein